MKKLLTLFTLLLCICSGAWGDDTYTYNFNGASPLGEWTSTPSSAVAIQATGSQLQSLTDPGSAYLSYSVTDNDSKIITIRSTQSYSNIKKISLKEVCSDNAKPAITIRVVNGKGETQATFLDAGGHKASFSNPGTNKWSNSTEFELANTATGYIEFYLNSSSTGKYGGFDDIVITYNHTDAPSTPTLTGAWKIGDDEVTSVNVVQGGSATMPTFTVGATSGTPTTDDYSVDYNEEGDAGIFTYTAGVPTGINTTATGSATVTATLTAVGTNYEAPTTNTFTYTVTVNAMLTQNSVSTSRTWDWSKLSAVEALTDVTNPTNAEDFVMANMDGVRYPDFNLGFNSNFTQEMAQEIVISNTQYVRRDGNGDSFQNGTIKINFAVPGKLTVYFTGTSGSGQTDRYVVFNGEQGSVATAASTQKYETFDVVPGQVNTIGFLSGKPLRIQKLVFVEAVPVEVSALGYATFASDKALDFTDKSIKAYKATASGTEVEFEQVNVVPANTGVLLYAVGGATVNVPVATAAAATAAADNFTDNKLVRGTGAFLTYEENVTEYYILANETAGIGFYKANNNKVATNRAYLDLTGTNAKSFTMPGGETDGIRSIDNSELRIENSNYYNLAGQRVGKDYKGIVIVNGKKYLRK